MDKRNLLILIISTLAVYTTAAAEVISPFQVQHQKPAFVERNTSFELSFQVPGIDAKDVEEAYLFYRPVGDKAYSQKEASLISSTFNISLAVEDRQTTGVEYYLRVQLKNGETLTYPTGEAHADPVRIEVIDKRKSEREKRVEETGVDYTILSPDPGSTVAKQDAVIALTLFYDPAEVDTANSSFRMLVDGKDVTDQAHADDYFYTYSTDDLPAGRHIVQFEIQKGDTALTIADWQFTVLDPSARSQNLSSADQRGSWMPEGNVQLSARSQQVGGNSNDALKGNVRISGRNGDISYSAYGLLTTQEDPRLQSQNRFGANLYIGDWLEFEAGHVYPNLSTFTIAGQRIQGLNTGLHLWDDALNMQVIYGNLRRGIDNLYNDIIVEEHTIEENQDPVYSYSIQPRDRGTFQRKILGGRLGTNRSDNLDFGLNFLKVEDDTESIRLIDGFNDLMETNPALVSGLNSQQMQDLQSNPDQLNINGNPAPKGNFVAATDFEARFDQSRIQLQADAAVSLLNQDISNGILNQDAAEDLGLDIDQNVEDMLDRLSWLIIINENMETLPIRFDTESAESDVKAFFPTSILATQSELGLQYLNNNVQLRYRWVGPAYNSLANTTVRKDIAGFTLSDRIQLFRNRIYLTLGYERLRDNVSDTKDATTYTNTYRTNLSWYPISQGLPNVSIGFMKRNRDNNVALNNPLVANISGVDESAAVRNLAIQNGDTVVVSNPRFTDTYQFTASVSQEFSMFGISHDASLNFSTFNTSDEVFAYGDSQNNSISLRVVNYFQDLPLQSRIGFNINNTETTNGLNDIQILGANIGGELFLLDDKLSLNMSFAVTKNRTETTTLITDDNGTPQEVSDDYYKPAVGDVVTVTENNSFIIGTGARYDLDENHSFLLNFRYSNVQNTISPSQSFPNDHLLQARYIFNF